MGKFERKKKPKNRPGKKKFEDILRRPYSMSKAKAMDIIRDPFKEQDSRPLDEEVYKLMEEESF